MDFYAFIEGPLCWLAFLVCGVGCTTRIILFLATARRQDKVFNQYFCWYYALASIFSWLLPFNRSVAKTPGFSIAAYCFHICLILPLFAYQHVLLLKMSCLAFSYPSLPAELVEWLTLLFLAITIYLLLRRIFSPNIKLLTTLADYLLLIATALPFVTGYLAAHGNLGREGVVMSNMQLIHMLSGELILILIPFTKLSHFVLFFLSRAATGVEFGRRGYVA
ncbi:Nitrate reductase [Desulfovibrionales bacterium]